jgi:hypothetical protein
MEYLWYTIKMVYFKRRGKMKTDKLFEKWWSDYYHQTMIGHDLKQAMYEAFQAGRLAEIQKVKIMLKKTKKDITK